MKKTSDGIRNGAAQTGSDLIVIGTHGRSGVNRAFLGSVAESVLRHSDLPVLTVRPNDRCENVFSDIVVAVDDSACSARGVDMAAEIAQADRSTLYLLHVVPHGASTERSLHGRDVLQSSAERARKSGAAAYLYDAIGDAGFEICAFANQIKAQLVVAGSHGRTGVIRAAFGSVAEDVVRHAPCPVLVAG